MTKKTLLQKCKEAGIEVLNPSGYLKKDLIHMLQEKFLALHPSRRTEGLQERLQYESPCLCTSYKDLKSYETFALDEEGSRWYLEENVDGARCIVTITEEGICFWGREVESTDCLPLKYRVGLVGDGMVRRDETCEDIPKELTGTTFDIRARFNGDFNTSGARGARVNKAEQMLKSKKSSLVQMECPLELVVIDVMRYEGKDVTSQPLEKRLELRKKIISTLASMGYSNFKEPVSVFSGKEDGYLDLVANGSDGVIYKNLDSVYVPKETRKKNCWVKKKPSMTGESSQIFQAILGGSSRRYDTERGEFELEGFHVVAFDMQFRPRTVGILKKESMLVDISKGLVQEERKSLKKEHWWKGTTFIGKGWDEQRQKFKTLRIFGNKMFQPKTLEEVCHPFLL